MHVWGRSCSLIICYYLSGRSRTLFTTALSWFTQSMRGGPSVLSLLCSQLLLCVCWAAAPSSPPPSQWRLTERYTRRSSSKLGPSQLSLNSGWRGAVCVQHHVPLLGLSLILRLQRANCRASVDVRLCSFVCRQWSSIQQCIMPRFSAMMMTSPVMILMNTKGS